KVPTLGLVSGHKYRLKIAAIDGAGNIGGFTQGDGFTVTSANYSLCENDNGAPEINVIINDTGLDSCISTPVKLVCNDLTSCSITYNKAASASLCMPSLPYNGQNILFESSGWICYAVTDNNLNNYTGVKKITLDDSDGDKVLDRCDQCSDTAAGKIVDELGCAAGQMPPSESENDKDQDGLPDAWEKLYDSDACPLDYQNADSNGDTISDNLENYDDDSYSNYQEYVANTDPCAADRQITEPAGTAETAPETKLLAWTLLILGLVLFMGGSGYLIYYYRFAKRSVGAAQYSRPTVRPILQQIARPGRAISSWAQRLSFLQRKERERAKERSRREVFG
ncbi:MAG: hypothetical protein AABX05_00960, partial [Nanoarchaeota archaeon]